MKKMSSSTSDIHNRSSLAIVWSRVGQWFDRHTDWVIGLFVIVFGLSGVITLHNYGITWDEGLGNLFFGERIYAILPGLIPRI